MSRLIFLLLALNGLFLAAFSDARAAETAPPPNFVFFITDDISPDDLGCYGNEAIETPNLDSIAKQGLVFDNAYLTISSCSPSRCSIVTGRYPHNTGAPELHTKLPSDQHTFIQDLRAAGYYTLISGKNHMAKQGKLTPAQALLTQAPQPSEMLFNVKDDPYQWTNLAAQAECTDTLRRMRTLLDRWKDETGDSLPVNPTPSRQPLHESVRKGPARGEFPGHSRGATRINEPGPVRLGDRRG